MTINEKVVITNIPTEKIYVGCQNYRNERRFMK